MPKNAEHVQVVDEFRSLAETLENILTSQYQHSSALSADLRNFCSQSDFSAYEEHIAKMKAQMQPHLEEIFESHPEIKSQFISLETRLTNDLSQNEGYAPNKFPLIQNILKNYFELAKLLPQHQFRPPISIGNPVISMLRLSTESLEGILAELLLQQQIYSQTTKSHPR